MDVIRIQGGHRFRIKGRPAQTLKELDRPTTVALSPASFYGLKPRVVVKIGDQVLRGQELFHHKKDPRLKFVSPGGGCVAEIRYGPRRTLQSIVVELAADEPIKNFGPIDPDELNKLSKEAIVERLLQAGLWPFLRSFPGWNIPPLLDQEQAIAAVYVSGLSTEPHVVESEIAIRGNEDYFRVGLEVLKKLTPKTYLCTKPGDKWPNSFLKNGGVIHRAIEDRYPAENVGVQLRYTERLKKGEVVIGASIEAVIGIGHLMKTGYIRSERTYCVAGSGALERAHFRGRSGMRVADITGIRSDRREEKELRFIAGGLFTGNRILAADYVGIHDMSIQVMEEDRKRIPFIFFRTGFDRLTLFRAWASGFRQDIEREGTTSNNGEERACIQCHYCIDICPVRVMPNLIMKASLNEDIEEMEALSIHDCVDCGLCTFVCPSKIELGRDIENGKRLIAKEG